MSQITHKNPGECTSMNEIREQIDLLDAEIIRLFAERHHFVEEIVKYKSDAESVVAIERKLEVIRKRGEWAGELGLDSKTFEIIYTILVDSNIQKEMELLNSGK